MGNPVGAMLKAKRKENKLPVKDVIGKLRSFGIDISDKTLYGWESGHRQPDADTFLTLCKIYGIESISAIDSTKTQDMPKDAQVVANDYVSLDEHGKRIVKSVIAEEKRRMNAETKLYEPKEVYPINSYLQPASAGCGDFTDDDCFEVIDLVKRPPNGTSFLVTVDGDSMEPTYHDGDKVFVHSQSTLDVGDIGVVAFGSDMYIKEQGENCLISHKPAYDPKYPDMDTLVRVYGKVLGVCTDDYFG